MTEWADLSSVELRARLRQRGVDEIRVWLLADRRDEERSAREIDKILGVGT